MTTKKNIYDGQYANNPKSNSYKQIALNCMEANDIYCINNIGNPNVKSDNDCGIIAGLGNDSQIQFLVQVDLDKSNERAKINISYLKQALSAPALNTVLFLNTAPKKKVYSLDVTYNLGVKIENDLKQKHQKYLDDKMKKIPDPRLIVTIGDSVKHM